MKTLPITYVAPAENTGIVNARDRRSDARNALSALEIPIAVVVAVLAGITDPARLAMIDLPRLSDKRNAVNLGKPAQHLQLDPADRGDVEKRHRDQTGGARPQRETIDQIRRILVAILVRQLGADGTGCAARRVFFFGRPRPSRFL